MADTVTLPPTVNSVLAMVTGSVMADTVTVPSTVSTALEMVTALATATDKSSVAFNFNSLSSSPSPWAYIEVLSWLAVVLNTRLFMISLLYFQLSSWVWLDGYMVEWFVIAVLLPAKEPFTMYCLHI